ncbi:glycosyltransferase family 2 protein [uncultured Rikenella sp.]|uniref:glycosyltransferase family 2 protein n=1 Tax=uncultured Rikenella sp. TaxID=368003 RepID=UPI0026080D5B|nr:glycosyltransferase family 2 protein [uncultured Rikenella sp.]
MMKEYKVSVIVPCYNAEQFLTRCLDSLVNQTLEGIEIICVNDASPDNGIAILRDYEARYPNVVVIDLKENVRQGGARNRGIEIARGEYIGFVDADDWVDLRMFEKLYNKAKETKVEVVSCDYEIVNQLGRVQLGKLPDRSDIYGTITEQTRPEVILTTGSISCKLIRRELLERTHLRFPEQIFYEDNCFNTILGVVLETYAHLPQSLYYYFDNSDSTTRKRNSMRIADRFKSLDLQLDYMQSKGLELKYASVINYIVIRTLFNTVTSYLGTSDEPDRKVLYEVHKRLKLQVVPENGRNPYVGRLFSSREKLHLMLFRFSPRLYMTFREIKRSLRLRKHKSFLFCG